MSGGSGVQCASFHPLPYCWAHRKARELTGICGISSSASGFWPLTPPPSACPFPSSAAGSVTQPEELRGELIGRGGQKSQGRENGANQRGLSPWRAAVGPSHAHNSSSSSPCGKEKRCFNGSVGRGEERKGGDTKSKEKEREREVQIQMSMCRHSEESLLADRVIYWILPVNHCRPVAKRISSKAERQPRETGL